MNGPKFFDTQNVFCDDLDAIVFNAASQSVVRSQASLGSSGGFGKANTYMTGSVVKGGVYGSPADYNVGANFRATKYSTTQILVYAGTALDPQGNMIAMNSSQLVAINTSTSTSKWTAAANVLNYIKLSYQFTSGSAKADDYGNTHYTRYYDSYYITVNNVTPGYNDILLGTFVGDGTGAISDTVVDRRLYVRTITPANAAILDPTIKPVSSWLSVEDHITAVGAGTPTQTNPHGLTLEDLDGFTTNQHVRLQHTNGIILNDASDNAKNSWKAAILGDNSTIHFNAPYAATASVGGHEVSNALSDYPVKGPLGNYYICMDATGSVAQISYADTGLQNRGSAYMKICAIEVYNVVGALADDIRFIANLNNPAELTGDCRQFYSTTQAQVRADFIEASTQPVAFTDDNKLNSLQTNLERIRYQLGIALVGSGSTGSWKLPSLLTGGASSNADALHSHRGTSFNNFGVNLGSAILGPGEYRFYKGSADIYASLYYNPALSLFTLWDDAVAQTLANIKVSSIMFGSGSTTSVIDTTKAGILTGGATSNADTLHTHILSKVTDPVYIGTVPFTGNQAAELTGGSVSNADNLHTHASGSSPFHIGSSSLTQAQVNTLVGGTSSNADALHTHSAIYPFCSGLDTYNSTNRTGEVYYKNTKTGPMLVKLMIHFNDVNPGRQEIASLVVNATTVNPVVGGDVVVALAQHRDTSDNSYFGVTLSAVVPPQWWYRFHIDASGAASADWSTVEQY